MMSNFIGRPNPIVISLAADAISFISSMPAFVEIVGSFASAIAARRTKSVRSLRERCTAVCMLSLEQLCAEKLTFEFDRIDIFPFPPILCEYATQTPLHSTHVMKGKICASSKTKRYFSGNLEM